MQLISSAFKNNGAIPSLYTCDGKNISPPLTILGIPSGARSLVLIVDDPDIPDFVKTKFGINEWVHWVVFNIAPDTKEILEGADSVGVAGITTNKVLQYGGPCPPDREHRYFFRLYALSCNLSLSAGATKYEVLDALAGHVLETAELVGRYQRTQK